MGSILIKHAAKHLDWLRGRAKKVSTRTAHGDTEEIMSTSIRRMGDVEDPNGVVNTEDFKRYASKVTVNAAFEKARKAKRDRDREMEKTLLTNYIRHHAPEISESKIEEVIDEMLLLQTGLRGAMLLVMRGYNSKQIGAVHGLPASTVRTQISQARQIIRQRLEKACDDSC